MFLNKQVLQDFNLFPEVVVPLVSWFCVRKVGYFKKAYEYETHKMKPSLWTFSATYIHIYVEKSIFSICMYIHITYMYEWNVEHMCINAYLGYHRQKHDDRLITAAVEIPSEMYVLAENPNFTWTSEPYSPLPYRVLTYSFQVTRTWLLEGRALLYKISLPPFHW